MVSATDPVEQVVPDPTDECADADDVQVYARPYTPPSPNMAPKPLPRPLACPAI
jgi:hypothetical protein